MKQIDFLPSRYAERRVRRKSHLWRLFVIALFGAAVGAAAISQQIFHYAAKRQLEEVYAQHTQAETRSLQLSSLQRQLKKAQAEALLTAYLDDPWPWTRVLSSIASPLPDSVTLTELASAQEPRPVAPPTAEDASRRMPARDDSRRLLPEERDLAALRQQRDNFFVVLRVGGMAYDTADLHRYVERLSQAPLISKAEILSIEKDADGPDPAVRFRLRLELLSGYMQPGGPQATPENDRRGNRRRTADSSPSAASEVR